MAGQEEHNVEQFQYLNIVLDSQYAVLLNYFEPDGKEQRDPELRFKAPMSSRPRGTPQQK
jgi:hypothetical protein